MLGKEFIASQDRSRKKCLAPEKRTKITVIVKNIKKLTLAKNVMLDVSATAVAFFSKRLKLQMSNGVLMVHDMC